MKWTVGRLMPSPFAFAFAVVGIKSEKVYAYSYCLSEIVTLEKCVSVWAPPPVYIVTLVTNRLNVVLKCFPLFCLSVSFCRLIYSYLHIERLCVCTVLVLIKLTKFVVELRLHCGSCKLIFYIISSIFAKFKNVVHSLEPGETPSKE